MDSDIAFTAFEPDVRQSSALNASENMPSRRTSYEDRRSTDWRKDPRHPRNDPAQVRPIPGNLNFWPATVLDASRSGLGITLTTPLSRGCRIEVRLSKQAVVFGEVRHCNRIGQDFRVGIVIEAAFYSESVYMPCTTGDGSI